MLPIQPTCAAECASHSLLTQSLLACPPVPLQASFSYVGNEGTEWTFVTNLDAPRYRCAALSCAVAGAWCAVQG